MNILVAGGAGYIGSVLTAELVNSGHTVTVLDNLSTGHLNAVHPAATFVHGDITDKAAVGGACRNGIDVAMHFAAFIEVGESVDNPAKYYANNVNGARLFFDNLRAAGVTRLVFSSTAAVYGEPEHIPLTETSALRPANPYGWTKRIVEQILADYDRAYGFRSVSLRYFNAGGATVDFGEDHRPESHLIPRIFESVIEGREIRVFGDDYDTPDGSCVRDYIHVSDLAQAHILAASYLMNVNSSECFNLGTGRGFSVLDVIDTVSRVIGRPVPFTIVPRRPGDTARLVASPEKARTTLGWGNSLLPLETIVESAWRWKTRFPKGYGD